MGSFSRLRKRRRDLILDDDPDLTVMNDLMFDSEPEEEAEAGPGGSKPGKMSNINRNRQAYSRLLHADYFSNNATYSRQHFRRRFRMRIELFLKITEDIQRYDNYFRQKRDCTGLVGFTPVQKCAAAIRLLASGSSADEMDDRYRLAESTMLETLKRFCNAIVGMYGDEYLRYPTEKDLQQLLALHEAKGWPGMLGSIDCTHWSWKNCPKAWAGQYSGNMMYDVDGRLTRFRERRTSHNCTGSYFRPCGTHLALFFWNARVEQ